MHIQNALTNLTAAGTGSYEDTSIRLAGGNNVAAEVNNVMPVNRERIAVWDPELILLNGFEQDLRAVAKFG